MGVPDPATLEAVEWQRLLEALAARAATPDGARAALALPWLPDRAAVEASLGEVAEAAALAADGATPDLAGVPEATEARSRLRIDAVLEDDELVGLGRTLSVASAARRALRARRQVAPRLAAKAEQMPDLGIEAAEILSVYTPEGHLADHASPGLRDARAEAALLRTRIVAGMDEAMETHAGVLQDRYTTLRGGRWVLPVRADAHERVPGIVHGASQSGATLFVEPQSVVPIANRLRVTLAAVEREEARVRAELASLLSARADDVDAACEALAQIDLRLAAGDLMRALGLTVPKLADTPCLRLLDARHPLLVLAGRPVVGNDLPVEAGQALVVSGPNAGGKTVSLKTSALCGLMLRAGLPLPAAQGSEAGLFECVVAEIGDAQSLDLSLSTFSARMTALARILESTTAGDLVALDEVCAGTDPEEGAALAAAAVEALVERGAAVVATTHYPALKEMAASDPRMTNASVGFDPETLSPTFRLHLGVPGPSAALHVAARCGIPLDVVARARERVPQERRLVSEAAERALEAERRAQLARDAAEARLKEADEAKERAMREIEVGREKGKREVERQARDLVATVQRVRTEVMEAEGRIRRRGKRAEEVQAAKETVAAAAEVVAPGGKVAAALVPQRPESRPATEADLRAGVRVWLTRLGAEATIVAPPSGAMVKVTAGAMRMAVKVADLRILPPKEKAARPARMVIDPAGDPTSPSQTDSNTVDVRGLRADEAEAEIDRFLDRLLRESRTAGFVIHGHGTGALRKAIRRFLAGSSYVARHRPGEQNEGGDGVTVVWLK